MRITTIAITAVLTLVSSAAGPILAREQRSADAPAAFERDRRAILAMAGAFDVRFDMRETVPFADDYRPLEPKISGGNEVVRVVEDTGRVIRLQHLLVAGAPGGVAPTVIKHWRQDWEFEPASVLVYENSGHWKLRALSAADRRGRWAQTVWQTDDSPRYGGIGVWKYDGGVARWTSDETRRPLARRDAVRHPAYDHYVGTNRHAISPAGWVHEQDNAKRAGAGDAARTLVHEVVLNTYTRSTAFNVAAADKYWDQTSAYWSKVRDAWDETIKRRGGVAVAEEADTGSLPASRLMGLAARVAAGARTLDSAVDEARRIITAVERGEALPAAVADASPAVVRNDLAPGLYEIAYSARRQSVFVASTGNASTPARILRLDPGTLEMRGAIPLSRRGYGLVLDDAADRLYVGHSADGSVSVVNTVTGEVIATIEMSEKTKNAAGQDSYRHHFRELAVDRTNHRMFAPGLAVDGSALYVVDTRALKVERVIPGLGFVATGLALDEAGGRVYVSNLEGRMFVFDTRTLALVSTWSIGVDQPLNLAFDRAGKRLFATDEGIASIDAMRKPQVPGFESSGPGHRVAVISADNGKLLASFPVGRQPIVPLLDARRNRLFVSNREDGTVTVYDAATHRLLHTIPLPQHPNSFAIDEAEGVVYVTIKARSGSPESAREGVARIALP